VANLTLVATSMGMMGKAYRWAASSFVAFYRGLLFVTPALLLRQFVVTIPPFALVTERPCPAEGSFRLDF